MAHNTRHGILSTESTKSNPTIRQVLELCQEICGEVVEEPYR